MSKNKIYLPLESTSARMASDDLDFDLMILSINNLGRVNKRVVSYTV